MPWKQLSTRTLCKLLPILFTVAAATAETPGSPPNIVIIFLDDSGFGDFAPFSPGLEHATPHVDRLASEGCSYKNFYVPQAICSASRAALLTGMYPGRTGVFGAHAPRGRGLEPEFKILPELIKPHGYTSALFGKWHLGDQADTRPHVRGFDQTAGILYSNDMWEKHPTDPEKWGKYPLQYLENGKVIEERIDDHDQKQFTRDFTERAVRFIEDSADRPFFLYLAHPMPHVPLFCSDDFEGKSGTGLYGDVILELDWSVGQVNEAIKRMGLEDNTIVIFTSDNGPWLLYGEHAGQTPFREGKRTSFEGGTRSACIIKYPGHIEPGSVSKKAFCSIDLLPTLLNRIGVPLPNKAIDGRDQWRLISGKSDSSNPQPYYAFTTLNRLEAIMSADGRWKLHLEHPYRTITHPGRDALPGKGKNIVQERALYDLVNDPQESRNLIEQHPEIAVQLQSFATQHLKKFPKLQSR